MVIRTVQASDLPEIARLFYETVHHVNARDYTPEQIEAWAPEIYAPSYWQERFDQYQVYVAEEQGQVVGFSEFESTGHIDCFYVHYQWQRCGVGTQLIAQIETEAHIQNIPRLFADVSVTARPFFERHGFVVEREQERLYRDVLFQQFLMVKSLVPDDSRSTDDELIGRLRDAIANLVWLSEADYPLELQIWEEPSSEPLTAEELLALVSAPPESTLTEVDFAQFLEPATQCQDWYGDEEVAIAQQYQRLVDLLQATLNNLQVFKVGKQEIDIYIIGNTPAHQCIGITTKAIET